MPPQRLAISPGDHEKGFTTQKSEDVRTSGKVKEKLAGMPTSLKLWGGGGKLEGGV